MENRWRTLLIWHKLDSKDDDNDEMWLLNVKPESRVTPRSLADETGHSCCPRKDTVTSGSFDTSCRVSKTTSLVLSGFIGRWFAQHQPAIFSRSSETCCIQELYRLYGEVRVLLRTRPFFLGINGRNCSTSKIERMCFIPAEQWITRHIREECFNPVCTATLEIKSRTQFWKRFSSITSLRGRPSDFWIYFTNIALQNCCLVS